MARILIVDDEPEWCRILTMLLGDKGHEVVAVQSGESALGQARKFLPDIVLLDLHLGRVDGLEVLRRLKHEMPAALFVMMTAYGSIQDAVAAMRLGATDFVSKPFSNDVFLANIDALLELSTGRGTEGLPEVIGTSRAFRDARDLALKFAVPDINVLLQGETGTGKELFARTIHHASKRRSAPFAAVDCSSLPETLFESELFGHERGAFTGATASRVGRLEAAQGGTLFLDEIGNLPLPFQAKLLRVLQERSFVRVGGKESIRLDVRVVSATNVNLRDAVRDGRFREDLYYRLNEMTIELPPLRERTGDIGPLAEHFLRVYSARFGRPVREISAAALVALEGWTWPGNIRELENAMKSAVVLADEVVLPRNLPEAVTGGGPAANAVAEASPAAIHTAYPAHPAHPAVTGPSPDCMRVEVSFSIAATDLDMKAIGNRAAEQAERSFLHSLLMQRHVSTARLAGMLNVDPKTLRTKLRKYGLDQLYPSPGIPGSGTGVAYPENDVSRLH
jgi:DNA-binding NtrC family response regulator